MAIGPMTPMNEANRMKQIEQDLVENQERERELNKSEKLKEEKESKRWRINEIRAWITLAVSVAALFVSIVALFTGS